MIELYYYTSPNARKALMMLEEVGLPYEVRWIDISAGDQFGEAYRRDQPEPEDSGHRRPRWPGRQSRSRLFESGAILLYLAEKTGRLLPADPARRWSVIKWLFWQTSSQGPLLGQAAHFVSHAREQRHRCPVRGRAISQRSLRGSTACWSRSSRAATTSTASSRSPTSPPSPGCGSPKAKAWTSADFPNVKRWCDAIAQRPSARKKLDRDDATKQAAKTNYYTDETWNVLFGGRSPQRSPCA